MTNRDGAVLCLFALERHRLVAPVDLDGDFAEGDLGAAQHVAPQLVLGLRREACFGDVAEFDHSLFGALLSHVPARDQHAAQISRPLELTLRGQSGEMRTCACVC